MPTLPYEVAQSVLHDGLPRQATDDEGAVHVLYLDGPQLRSMLATEWPSPLPDNPTAEQISTALAERAQKEQRDRASAATLRQRVRSAAQSAVGARVDLLNDPQQRSLIALLLYKAGAIDLTGAVRPLDEWL